MLVVIGWTRSGPSPMLSGTQSKQDHDHRVTTSKTTPVALRGMWPFGLWLAIFYVGWLLIVVVGDHWGTVQSHWPIALAMSFGSYIAGSTPMGGGSIGFPVLVLFFELPGSLGRNFGLAVQSIGMVSASIYIFSARRPLDYGLLRPALLGALVGTPLGAAFVAPFVPDLWVKLTFAVVWCSFGIMHLVKLNELVNAKGESERWRSWDRPIGLAIGITGGVVSSVTGVGIDMIVYATLVLLYRADLKISIPTSVVLMAFASVVGIASNVFLSRINPSLYSIDPEVFANWLAAAPVVALGAPFGAIVVNLISRKPTLILVSSLCIAQFVWTIVHERVSGMALVGAIVAVLAVNAVFHFLYRMGRYEIPSETPLAELAVESDSEHGL
ncbi:sulfite exporter TauE/SafE family protein [Rubripirellula amarantea]|uniref:Probable membrane transporter protein n=1 Tax=Rubripirellula amarantea TaxID=2527999 RepID=A0A5C5WY56_9BACT|nr:sulfite exporter TauE/SafE family protein [Rubripirellula amarantea]MDA8745807.1 sulfite exporter TauE/SafE family protein [Rubripirellula amarantea]TWT55209.1 Sulfite exporter TauE/SafE [Rubripirellula amarantea]